MFVAGWQIYTENVIVTNNAKLTFNFEDQIIINHPFAVNFGSKLEIY